VDVIDIDKPRLRSGAVREKPGDEPGYDESRLEGHSSLASRGRSRAVGKKKEKSK
jgi:hypothetical protein